LDAMPRPAECVEIILEVQWRPHPRDRLKEYLMINGNHGSWPSKYRPCPLLKDAADHLGRKSGRGVYSY